MIVDGKHVKIADIMRPPHLIKETQTLKEALTTMIEERCNSLTVVKEDGTYAGRLSTVDIIKEVLPDYMEDDTVAARFANADLLREDASRVKDKQVKEFMMTDVPTINVDDSVVEAAVLAAKQGHGRITVVDAEAKPVGIMTRTEIKRVIGHFLDIPSALT